jgi:hypothetical protein
MADIADTIVSGILSHLANPVGEGMPAIEDTRVAEPGPPTGVQKFTGADASGAALAAKIGARVFQRARERRTASLKEEKLRLDEQYRQAQIAHLERAATSSAVPRDRTVTLANGKVITGLTAAEQVGYEKDIQNDPGKYEWDEDVPGKGKTHVKGTLAEMHAYEGRVSADKGRTEASSRIAAALSTRQENDRLRWITGSLSNMPQFGQITNQAYTAATSDAISEFEKPREQRTWTGATKTVQEKYDGTNPKHKAQLGALRQQFYQKRLQEAVSADSTARAPLLDELRQGAMRPAGGAPGATSTQSNAMLDAILKQIDGIANTATPDTFTVR